MEKEVKHFRGIEPVLMAKVLEGDGKIHPYREVFYFYSSKNDQFIGKIDPYTPPQEPIKE